jgi:GGDEF domain-containing protein
MVKLQQTYDDDTKEKMEVPIINGHSVEATLYSLNEFYEASEELSFDTGDELLCYFRHILRGTIKDDWDSIVNGNGFTGLGNRTPADFLICI